MSDKYKFKKLLEEDKKALKKKTDREKTNKEARQIFSSHPINSGYLLNSFQQPVLLQQPVILQQPVLIQQNNIPTQYAIISGKVVVINPSFDANLLVPNIKPIKFY